MLDILSRNLLGIKNRQSRGNWKENNYKNIKPFKSKQITKKNEYYSQKKLFIFRLHLLINKNNF